MNERKLFQDYTLQMQNDYENLEDFWFEIPTGRSEYQSGEDFQSAIRQIRQGLLNQLSGALPGKEEKILLKDHHLSNGTNVSEKVDWSKRIRLFLYPISVKDSEAILGDLSERMNLLQKKGYSSYEIWNELVVEILGLLVSNLFFRFRDFFSAGERKIDQ